MQKHRSGSENRVIKHVLENTSGLLYICVCWPNGAFFSRA